jgi:hypothetical protein
MGKKKGKSAKELEAEKKKPKWRENLDEDVNEASKEIHERTKRAQEKDDKE